MSGSPQDTAERSISPLFCTVTHDAAEWKLPEEVKSQFLRTLIELTLFSQTSLMIRDPDQGFVSVTIGGKSGSVAARLLRDSVQGGVLEQLYGEYLVKH